MPKWQDHSHHLNHAARRCRADQPIARRAPAVARLILGHVKRIFTWAIEQPAYGLEQCPRRRSDRRS